MPEEQRTPGSGELATPEPRTLAPQRGSTAGGELFALTGSAFSEGMVVLFDDTPASELTLVSSGLITGKTPPHAAGQVTVKVLNGEGESAELGAPFEYLEPRASDGQRPRVIGAVSTSNTSVRVSFSEPVGEGADMAANYRVFEAGAEDGQRSLLVLSAAHQQGATTVVLTTRAQNETRYRLTVTDVRDLEGNLLAPQELLIDPTSVEFVGTPPDQSSLLDGDDDTLFDNVEQQGWPVTVVFLNGDVSHSVMTSDPTLPDTDGDGLADGDELSYGTNPRDTDTDGDGLSDYDEVRLWASDPCRQDTDEDGFLDGIEVAFTTSPLLDDSDGDGMSDKDELQRFNRDPLIADLPMPQIVVADLTLQLKVTSSYTDENGTVRSTQTTASSSFSQSRSNQVSRSDTRSVESANKSSQELGVEVSYGATDGWGGKVNAKAGFEQSSSRGFSTTVDQTSAQASQSAYERSVSDALEASERRAVTREITEASVLANVNLANQSSIPFTLKGVEISVQQQDRTGDGSFRPIATLRPSGNPEQAFNLGPFDPERGPVVFENTEVFPNLVDDLLREPSGLVFKVSNFDVLDEQGRNFVFSSAVVNSRTAGLTIDFGDGTVESYRVATHATFDEAGRPRGISMARALEILGLTEVEDDPALPVSLPSLLPDATRTSYGTQRDAGGVERLVRVRGMQNDLLSNDPEKRFWTVQTNNTDLPQDIAFSEINVRAGHEYLIMFTRDVDEDGLFEAEENMYGSSDRLEDTDADGLLDRFEVREGWTVRRLPGMPYKVFSSPARPDSDLDGLEDALERAKGTDPNRRDTDLDGLLDGAEISETFVVFLFDGDADDSNNVQLTVAPYSDMLILDGGDGLASAAAQGDDEQLVQVGESVAPGTPVVGPGPNGVIDSAEAGDDFEAAIEAMAPGPDGVCDTAAAAEDEQVTAVGAVPAGATPCVRAGLDGTLQSAVGGDDFVRAVHMGLFSIDPTNQDTDFDGLPDGRELLVGTNPNARDSGSVVDADEDGLYDAEEDNGWLVTVGGTSRLVTSSKYAADTDLDGLYDVFERAIGSDPRNRDTDGDGLSDSQEFDPDDLDGYYPSAALEAAERRCAEVDNCREVNAPDPSERTRTDVRNSDSDGDGLGDATELLSSWTVSVYGAQPRPVRSKPYAADDDLDGLDDQQERDIGTDPNLADTDEDGSNDGAELLRTIGGVPSNPLRKDRRVTLTIPSYVTVIGDCDSGDDGGDFEGNLNFVGPSGSSVVAYNFTNCDGVDEGSSCGGTGGNRQFFLYEGQGFSYATSQVKEVDDGSGDEQLTTGASDSFDYTVTGGVRSYEISADATCRLSFGVNVTVD